MLYCSEMMTALAIVSASFGNWWPIDKFRWARREIKTFIIGSMHEVVLVMMPSFSVRRCKLRQMTNTARAWLSHFFFSPQWWRNMEIKSLLIGRWWRERKKRLTQAFFLTSRAKNKMLLFTLAVACIALISVTSAAPICELIHEAMYKSGERR